MVRASEKKITVAGDADLNTKVTPPFDLAGFRASRPLHQQLASLEKSERDVLLPHTVEQTMLSENSFGQQRFCQELQERRHWMAGNCSHLNWVDPIRDDRFRLIGRQYRFADADEAFAFKMRFG